MNVRELVKSYPMTFTYLVVAGIVAAIADLAMIINVESFLNETADGIVQSYPFTARVVSSMLGDHSTGSLRWVIGGSTGLAYFTVAGFLAFTETAGRRLRIRSEEQERQLLERLADQNAQLEEAQSARMRILTNVTHELNTPLTSVLAFCHVLGRNRSGTLSERDQKQIAAIQRNAEQVSFLVKELIEMSEFENRAIEIHPVSTDLEELVREIVESMEPIVSVRNQEIIDRTVSGTSVRVPADRNRINQVLTNLISNASKYSPEGTQITVKCGTSGHEGWLTITDHGEGIDPVEMQRIWDPFYRIDNQITRSSPGNGLGLAITRRIIELHRGSIDLSSTPGSGTTARFSLPLASQNGITHHGTHGIQPASQTA